MKTLKSLITLLFILTSVFTIAREVDSTANEINKGTYNITIIPAGMEYFYIRLYPKSEIKRENNPEKRYLESYYPGDYSLLYGFMFSMENLFGTGGFTTGTITFKYPNAMGLSDSDKGSLQMYRLNSLWDNYGFDMEYTIAKSFIHETRPPGDDQSNLYEMRSSMKAESFSVNLYRRLFEINNQKCSLAENLEPLKMPSRGKVPVWDLFYLMLSYDFLNLKSDNNLVSDQLLELTDNENTSSIKAHLFNNAIMLGAKFRIFDNFFYLASIPIVSVYYSYTDTASGREKKYGIESIFSSVSRYMKYAENPLEGYTKNVIRQALGYNNGNFYLYADFFYDIKNVSAGDYVVQQNNLFLQLSGGVRF